MNAEQGLDVRSRERESNGFERASGGGGQPSNNNSLVRWFVGWREAIAEARRSFFDTRHCMTSKPVL